MKLRTLTLLTATMIVTSVSMFAGPPLICQRIDIGDAKSLPWVDLNYQKGSGSYDLKNLAKDTVALLDVNPVVLARMETLRRATIYARQDSSAAKELLVKLYARAQESDRSGHPNPTAWFDAGYLAEAYKVWMGKKEPNPAAGMDGYAWIRKAIDLRGGDAEMEYGAALVTLSGPESAHREHVRKAMAGANADPLLARNLASSFHNESMAQLLMKNTAQ